jgi:4-amino-4-deoxy-L-arabinose transferase-like glycosyltransferase
MRSVSEDDWLGGLSNFFQSNKRLVVAALVLSLMSIGCFLQTERTDYVKNDRGWQFPTHRQRWETTLSDTAQQVKAVISLPEKLDVWQKGSVVTRDFNESEYDSLRLEFWASGKSTGAYSLAVKLNGREIKKHPRGIKGNARWHSVPLEGLAREAIRDVGEAEVIFGLSGAPNSETDYVTFYGDAAVTSRNSSFFDGADWTRDDLSSQAGDQQGEFYVRLAYARSIFADQSLTTERIVILLFSLNALSLLVVFRKEVNSFRVSDAFSSVVSILRRQKTIILLLLAIFLLALGLRVYFVTRYPQPKIIKDAALYDAQARNVVSGYGLSSRPPEIHNFFFGYPLFLASLYSVFGASLQVVYLSQAVLGSLLGFIVFGIAYQLFRSKCIGLTAALLAGVYPPFIEYTARVLTETLATFTLALFVYLSILALKSAKSRLIFLSGMAFGLAVLSRDLFFYLIIFILITAFITLWPRRKTALRFLALFLVGVILACSPVLARDAHLFGSFNFGRLVRIPLTSAFILVTDASQIAETDGLVRLAAEKPQQWEEALSRSPVEAVQEGSMNIIEGLTTDPLGYLAIYLEQWAPRVEFLWYRGGWHSAAIFGISPRRLLVFTRLIVSLALLGAVVCLREWKKHLLLYSLIVYPSLMHAMFLALPRYSIPWMSYGCVFAAVGVVTLITLVLRTGSKYLALSLIAWATTFAMAMDADKQSLLKLFGPLITYMYLFAIEKYLFVIELCLIALICFLLLSHKEKIPNTIISASAILIAFGYVSLRGQALPLSSKEEIPSILMDTDHYVGHLIDLPRWTQGYDHYYLKIKLDGAWIEPPQKKYGLRVFVNGEMIKEYPISNEVIHGWERIPIDKRFIEGQKKLYVSLQVFGAPDVFENYLAVFIQQGQHYGLSIFNDSTRYLSVDRDEEQNGTFLIGLEMRGKWPYRDVDLWLGSRLSQADKLSLLGDESGVWYNLGQKIRLIGHEVKGTVGSGETLRPRLYWQARDSVDKDYTVFVHLLDERGNLRAQQDYQPQRGDYPTSLWQRGEVIWDGHEIPLPPDLPAGTYRLVAGMYLLESMERLPVFDESGKRLPDDLIPLGEIQVVGF